MTDESSPARVIDVGELVFAAMGIYLLVGTAFPIEGMIFAATTHLSDPSSQAIALRFSGIDAVTRLCFGVGLVLSRKVLAGWFASDASLPGLARQDILALFLAAIGAWLCLRGIAATAHLLFTRGGWQNVSGGATLAILGAALFLGARGVARLWHQLRESG